MTVLAKCCWLGPRFSLVPCPLCELLTLVCVRQCMYIPQHTRQRGDPPIPVVQWLPHMY